jgi:putative endonuclease
VKFIEKLLSKNSSDEKATAVSIGQSGEETAVKILKKHGYKIIERNYRTRQGEIDIIAKDGEYTCFVEVKFRKNDDFGDPGDFIDERKQQKIIKAAQYYAVKKGIYDTPMRFDAVLISAGKEKKSNAEVIKDAFRL